MLLYDPVFVWCPCVIYEYLATLRHRNLNTVEIEMQLDMWCCREAGRRWELLHWVRQLLRSEMQGRKYKSLEEMEKKKKKRKNVSFVFFHWVKGSTSLYTGWISEHDPEHPIIPHHVQLFRNPSSSWGFGSVLAGLASSLWTKHFSFSGER